MGVWGWGCEGGGCGEGVWVIHELNLHILAYISISPKIHTSVSPYLHISQLHTSIYPYLYTSIIYPYLYISIHPYLHTCISISLYLHTSISPYIHISIIHISIHPYLHWCCKGCKEIPTPRPRRPHPPSHGPSSVSPIHLVTIHTH